MVLITHFDELRKLDLVDNATGFRSCTAATGWQKSGTRRRTRSS